MGLAQTTENRGVTWTSRKFVEVKESTRVRDEIGGNLLVQCAGWRDSGHKILPALYIAWSISRCKEKVLRPQGKRRASGARHLQKVTKTNNMTPNTTTLED